MLRFERFWQCETFHASSPAKYEVYFLSTSPADLWTNLRIWVAFCKGSAVVLRPDRSKGIVIIQEKHINEIYRSICVNMIANIHKWLVERRNESPRKSRLHNEHSQKSLRPVNCIFPGFGCHFNTESQECKTLYDSAQAYTFPASASESVRIVTALALVRDSPHPWNWLKWAIFWLFVFHSRYSFWGNAYGRYRDTMCKLSISKKYSAAE